MNLFTYYRKWRTPNPPLAVVQAACALYRVPIEQVTQVEGHQLSTLSKNLWVVTLNQQQRALVVESEDEQEPPLATVWEEE